MRWDTLYYCDKDGVEHAVKQPEKIDVILQPDGSTVRKHNTDHYRMQEKYPDSLECDIAPHEDEIFYRNLHDKFLCKEHKKQFEEQCEPQWCIICCKEEKEDK